MVLQEEGLVYDRTIEPRLVTSGDVPSLTAQDGRTRRPAHAGWSCVHQMDGLSGGIMRLMEGIFETSLGEF